MSLPDPDFYKNRRKNPEETEGSLIKMGIPYFLAWLKKNRPELIRALPPNKSISDTVVKDYRERPIETLCLDLNAIFHNVVQEVLAGLSVNYPISDEDLHRKMRTAIGEAIHQLVWRVRPTKRVLAMIDGVAGMAKQSQQRQRRYRAVSEPPLMVTRPDPAVKGGSFRTEEKRVSPRFNTNNISCGTVWMHQLSGYLDWFFRKQISVNPVWKGLDVIFSSEKAPGEGEHKLINWIRRHGEKSGSYLFVSPDADLYMLALGIQNTLMIDASETFAGTGERPMVYVFPNGKQQTVRTLQGRNAEMLINVGQLRDYLVQTLSWYVEDPGGSKDQPGLFEIEKDHDAAERLAEGKENWDVFGCDQFRLIEDVIFLWFLLGNDFLPHPPGVNLLEGGIEQLFDSYKIACGKSGAHLVISNPNRKTVSGGLAHLEKRFNPLTFKELLHQLTLQETGNLLTSHSVARFKDPILARHINTLVLPVLDGGKPREEISFDFTGFKAAYYRERAKCDPRPMCLNFLRGMEWVINYYTCGIPDWNWSYGFNYAPFMIDLLAALDSYVAQPFVLGNPMTPLQQLACILPPQSKDLLPGCLQKVSERFPLKVELDLAGKKADWQSVVLVPPLPANFLSECVTLTKGLLEQDRQRNYNGMLFAHFEPEVPKKQVDSDLPLGRQVFQVKMKRYD